MRHLPLWRVLDWQPYYLPACTMATLLKLITLTCMLLWQQALRCQTCCSRVLKLGAAPSSFSAPGAKVLRGLRQPWSALATNSYKWIMLLMHTELSQVAVRSCLSWLQRSCLADPEGALPALVCSGKGGVAGRSFSAQRDKVSPTMLLSTPCSIASKLSLHLTAAEQPTSGVRHGRCSVHRVLRHIARLP